MLDPPPSTSVQRPRPQAHSDGADSNSDWDDDDDFVSKKINIKIKPIAQATPGKISASTDELRAAVGTWKSMANINLVKPNSRRSMNQGNANDKGTLRSNNDQARIQPPPRISDGTHNQFIVPDRPQSAMVLPPPPLRLQQAPLFSSVSTVPIEPLPAQFGAANLAPLIPPPAQPRRPSLPVAFAIQECLNLHALMSSEGEISTSLIGHIKVAVPRSIIEMNATNFENNDLIMRIRSTKRWSCFKTNSEFVRRLENEREEQGADGNQYFKLMSLDMLATYNHARQRYQKQPDSQYFLLPELVSYTIRSQDNARMVASLVPDGTATNHQNMIQQLSQPTVVAGQQISPIRAVVHWLCALSVTKVRVDMDFLEDFVELEDGIRPQDVRNIKLSMEINGNVVAQQSKPEASWCPLESRLTWSFASYQELISISPVNGATSCLAKFTLSDGPSTPSATSLQFSISGKTISGLQMAVVQGSDARLAYKLARQKKEVRTGTFRCEPPCL